MNELSLADVAALRGNNDDGFGGGNGWWVILLFILLGGWGNRGWGNQGAGSAGGNELYPWLNQTDTINGGFRDQMLQSGISGIQQSVTSGFANAATQLCQCCGDMQMALCNGFAGVNAGMAAGFAGVEAAANARQMANMNQQFAQQTATLQGFNALQAQIAQGDAAQQLGMSQQTATILAEHCSDRAALSDGVRDIIASQVAGDQRIIDKLCQLEMDGYKREAEAERRANDQLRAELTQARFDASQQAQNAYIQQGFANEVDALYNRLSNCPVPSMPVYGRTPIFTCQPQNQGCGCGCGSM